jgi:endoglucanase
MKQKFVDKGIPVVLGEYAAMLRTNLTGDALALHKKPRASITRNYATQCGCWPTACCRSTGTWAA